MIYYVVINIPDHVGKSRMSKCNLNIIALLEWIALLD